jgi:hypothetical protein
MKIGGRAAVLSASMKLANATNLNRKSGVAQWRACPERSRTGTCGSLDTSESLLEMIFDRADDAHRPLVVVVNHELAEHYWPHQDPIGSGCALARS